MFKCTLHKLLFLLCIGIAPSLVWADVQVTLFSDINLSSWSGTGNLVDTNELCVYRSNTGQNTYDLSVTENEGSFNFRAGGYSIPYTVKVNGASVTHGSTHAMSNASNTSGCGGTPNVTIEVTVLESALSAAMADAGYQTQLIVTVSMP